MFFFPTNDKQGQSLFLFILAAIPFAAVAMIAFRIGKALIGG